MTVRRRPRTAARLAVAVLALLSGCVTRRVPDPGPPMIILPPQPTPDTAPVRAQAPELPGVPTPDAPSDGLHDVRVGLATAAQEAPLTATGAWRLVDANNSVLVRGRAADAWTIQRRGSQLRAVSRTGQATPWGESPVTLRTESAVEFVQFGTRRYRGALRVVASDSGLVVVNVLPVEDYLRGVVPLEIGSTRGASEQAAVEAQAIAARSYTWVRLMAAGNGNGRNANFDVAATVADQVYGGADAERPSTDDAVRATVGLVLKYGGRVVDAPYSSSCGGETAAPDEVWRVAATSAYLRRVSDRIPGSADRYFCDIAPRFSWTRTFTAAELDQAARAYLRQYAEEGGRSVSHVRGLSVESRTPSGRVARTVFLTDAGVQTVRGNDVRSVLRTVGGEILNSTYFSVSSETARDGSLVRVVLRGNGYGHGVGMCQWGAIGRARAGQTARAILAAYYPGTSVGPAS